MHWWRLRPCPSPCNPAYEIGRCEGRSIDKGRIIGLDSSNPSKPSKLCLATGLWRIQRWYLAGTIRYIEQQLEHHRISCARSYRTLRDGSFEGGFPRHFVPGYNRSRPYGTRIQSFRNSLRIG